MLHDRPHHLAQRWITYRRRSAVGDLFLGPYPALIAALTSKRTSRGLGSSGLRRSIKRHRPRGASSYGPDCGLPLKGDRLTRKSRNGRLRARDWPLSPNCGDEGSERPSLGAQSDHISRIASCSASCGTSSPSARIARNGCPCWEGDNRHRAKLHPSRIARSLRGIQRSLASQYVSACTSCVTRR
jgi:hypothetical protein